MKNSRRVWIIVSIIVVFLLAVGLRTYAAYQLHVDHDETTYLIASNTYSNYLRDGKYNWLAWEDINYEHPPMSKILYGFALLSQPRIDKVNQTDLNDEKPIEDQQAYRYAMSARLVSVGFGSLAVLVLAIFNPLAGFFLAIDSLAIKYTSEIYLEALPMMASLLAVVAYTRFYTLFINKTDKRKKAFLWLAVSGVALGLTAASKYTYVVAGIAIVVHWLIAVLLKKIPVKTLLIMLGWGAFSIFMFFVFDPYLWVHTFERLVNTLSYHLRFSQTKFVQTAMYPVWQPINWLFRPFGHYSQIHDPYPNDAILLRLDTLIFFLAVLGFWRTIKKHPVFFIWIVVGLAMLFLWDTKWAQYPLIILVPWCYSASQGTLMVADFVKGLLRKKEAQQSV